MTKYRFYLINCKDVVLHDVFAGDSLVFSLIGEGIYEANCIDGRLFYRDDWSLYNYGDNIGVFRRGEAFILVADVSKNIEDVLNKASSVLSTESQISCLQIAAKAFKHEFSAMEEIKEQDSFYKHNIVHGSYFNKLTIVTTILTVAMTICSIVLFLR